MKQIFRRSDILLPKFHSSDNWRKWSVIACDQFTSEPGYWENTKRIVGQAPSTLNLILPEAYLKKSGPETNRSIAETMEHYKRTILCEYKEALLYVERIQSDGKLRRGVVGMIDLEEYDYTSESVSPVRATEGTVLDRIPPRVKIRESALLELPHIMILTNDPHKKVEAAIDSIRGELSLLYDFDLMQGGGHLRGFCLEGEHAARIEAKINEATASSSEKAPVLFAVGDGNHSLASAKAHYENLKKQIGADAAAKHPARFALCEIVNIHDDALTFEPIYRVVFHVDPADLLHELKKYTAGNETTEQAVHYITEENEGNLIFGKSMHPLTVGTLQKFLDKYIESHPDGVIDYIHGEASLTSLAKQPNTVGFLFSGMKKDELFSAVEESGALPRKTFSMGHAEDKRYYTEARAIRE